MAFIELKHIFKRFGKLVVLKDLSLNIEKGQSLVVIGASGTGKSVLLKLLIGLEKPDAGSIQLDGQDILSASLPELAVIVS